jgi:chromosome segregation ATPase
MPDLTPLQLGMFLLSLISLAVAILGWRLNARQAQIRTLYDEIGRLQTELAALRDQLRHCEEQHRAAAQHNTELMAWLIRHQGARAMLAPAEG